MKTTEVKILLQKYYNGLTSPDEESNLEEYFLSEATDPEFEADKLHFLAVAAMRDEDIEVPADLETAVLHKLDETRRQQLKGSRRIIYVTLSVAAGLMLMVSTYLFLSRQDRTLYIDDPKLAYAESHEALEMVSKMFNQGTAQLSGLKMINSAVEPLGKLNTLDQAARSLSMLGKYKSEK